MTAPDRRLTQTLAVLTAALCLGWWATHDASAIDDEPAAAFTDEQLAFFETSVRPVLAEHCYACHSHDAERARGGLYVDSRAGLLAAGVVTPGDPDRSTLIAAVRWELPNFEMPPTHQLPDDAVAALERWVAEGLPWPDEPAPGDAANIEPVFDLAARRAAHWAWHPPQRDASLPPGVAASTTATIDHLVARALAEQGLSRSEPADPATLLRRVTFDLTGLPPTPDEIAAFLADPSPAAYEATVDRLLASPAFGEKWARHWLDLVRYAETLGHEFDFNIHDPWRYRDYVIRALNDDLPYDRFVREHIAGDLIDPRVHPDTQENQAPLATAFYWLGEQTHAPVDVKQHQADRIDNQIDVLTKTFQAMTVACARCHDHKFDAISAADYYRLYGVLQSTRWTPTAITNPPPTDAIDAANATVATLMRDRWDPAAERLNAYLAAAVTIARATHTIPTEDDQRLRAQTEQIAAAVAAAEGTLDADRLTRWVALLFNNALQTDQHPLHTLRAYALKDRAQADAWWPAAVAHSNEEAARLWPRDGDTPWLDVADPTTFLATGTLTATTPNTLLPSAGHAQAPGQLTAYPALTTVAAATRAQGLVRTQTRPLTDRYLHVLAQGRAARVNVVIDGFRIIRAPIYGDLTRQANSPYPHWHTFDVGKWADGERVAYVELIDTLTPDPGGGGSPPHAHATLYQIVASPHATPGPSPGLAALAPADAAAPESDADFAQRFNQLVLAAAAAWRSPDATPDAAQLALLSALFDTNLLALPSTDADAPAAIADAVRAVRDTNGQYAVPPLALAAAEGTGIDAAVFNRGNPHAPTDPAARGFITAIVGDQPPAPTGSGRLQLADTLTSPTNPLTARVIVNRLWAHLLGRGIVPTADNFGHLGEAPSHPQLLDELALRFIDDGWSIKTAIRHIVLSDTYRQASERHDADAERIDPTNRLLHRQRVRRLTAESLRDTILATAGTLDRAAFGPPVPPHLTDFMTGRGRPGHSGPLDGNGRRSIYLGVRRNFLNPLMLAFDAPIPFSTVGRRNVTNVPAQALLLLNDPFIHDQAQRWADALVAQPHASIDERLDAMVLRATGHAATEVQRDALRTYVQERASTLGLTADQTLSDPRPWRDTAHVLFNAKAFLFVR